MDPARAFCVDVDTVIARIVGLPLGSSHEAMYSGNPIGVLATSEGMRSEVMLDGNVVVKTPVLERPRRRRPRTVDSYRDGILKEEEEESSSSPASTIWSSDASTTAELLVGVSGCANGCGGSWTWM